MTPKPVWRLPFQLVGLLSHCPVVSGRPQNERPSDRGCVFEWLGKYRGQKTTTAPHSYEFWRRSHEGLDGEGKGEKKSVC